MVSSKPVFRLTILGEFGALYDISGSTNLSDWSIAGAVTNTYGRAQFTDPAGTRIPYQFYRATAR